MRIGMVCPYSFDKPGGVQSHVLDLARVFRARGHDVRVLGPASASTPLPTWVRRGGPAVPLRYNGSVARIAFGPQVSRVTREFLRNGNFDVLHVHEPNSPSYSMVATRLARGPIVATYHASARSSYALRFALPMLRGNLEKIRGGIAVSELARRWQVEQVGTDPIVIPNGVDTALFRRARESADGWKASADTDAVEIVFLGRLDEPRKGLGTFLGGVEKLGLPVRVTVMGAGHHRPVPGVRFVGAVSDAEKAAILGRADIFVAPNTGGESFGIVLVEAMAAGCAVVASDLEAFARVCGADTAQPAGVLFPVGDEHALADCLRALVTNPQLRRQLVARGMQRARDYDWATVADRIMAVYETVAPVGPGAAEKVSVR